MKIQTHFDLSSYNSLQLRSQAEYFLELNSLSDLHELQNDRSLQTVSWRILGGGSNLVLPKVVQGLVIKPSILGRSLIHEDSDYWFVQASAGENWHEFVQYTLQQGFSGLENLSLIPGTVGAAPIQNIGAYGVEIKDFLWEVHCVHMLTGESHRFTNEQCQFSYRNSYFKSEDAGKYLIWDVIFRLPKKFTPQLNYGDIKNEVEAQGSPLTPQKIANAVIKIRQVKLPDPKIIGNAGSFFKNPIISDHLRDELLQRYPNLVSYPHGENEYKLAAGWLIEQSGWKGQNQGPVGMFERQALVLVNHGQASADDVWSLAKAVIDDVYKKFGVVIEPEPIKW